MSSVAVRLDLSIGEDVVKGLCDGRKDALCALVGGETAKMAEFFLSCWYDVVGACDGAIARDKKVLRDKHAMDEGDVLLGLAGNGYHSKGFSLIRKIIEKAHLRYSNGALWNRKHTVGQNLLTPTHIYVQPLLKPVEKDLVKGTGHITGGGLWGNAPRMLPKSLAAELDPAL